MVLPPKVIHPIGEQEIQLKMRKTPALVADTFAGRYISRGIYKHKFSEGELISPEESITAF